MKPAFLYVLTIFFILFPLFFCRPLSEKENENRLATCGIKNAAKIYRGRVAAQSEAPWTLFMEFILKLTTKYKTADVCTATVISPRHILTATHCVAPSSPVGFLNAKRFSRKKCNGSDYVIEDESVLKMIQFNSNGTVVAENPERVILVNACVPKTVGPDDMANLVFDDIAIVELREELQFSPTLQMVCVPRDTSDIEDGVELEIFGFGSDPSDPINKESGKLRHETTEIIIVPGVPEFWLLSRDPKKKNIVCPGDSGSGAVREVNGRTTIIGVLSKSSCESGKTGEGALELHSAVGFYSEIICELTGICAPPDDDDGSHSKQGVVVLFIVMFFLFLQ